MHKKLFIANWKSHKTKDEAVEYFKDFSEKVLTVDLTNVEIIIAPPFTLLPVCSEIIKEREIPVLLSSQNVSSFPQGAYTGEVSAKQIREFADYVIVGHSERRKYQHENETDLENKIRESKDEGLKVIQCIQDENSTIHRGVDIVAYEPLSAIGSGEPDDPKHIEEVFEILRKRNSDTVFLYGGSVSPETISQFNGISNLGGFLVGGASLTVDSFIALFS
jgi:triosephosphate isomerase